MGLGAFAVENDSCGHADPNPLHSALIQINAGRLPNVSIYTKLLVVVGGSCP